jgi:single-stranded DNA-binding protein
MNNCILMAEIVQDPQLRYTQDKQIPIAETLVQFPGFKSNDPPSTLKVVGWGNLAQTIQESCHTGDRVVVEGNLHMMLVERPEGFKEKRAELRAIRIHHLDGQVSPTNSQAAATAPSPTPASTSPSTEQPPTPEPSTATSPPPSSPTSDAPSEESGDDIPF